MGTRILILSQQAPEALRLALQMIQRGGMILFPTESVYGLGVDSTQPAAIKRLHDLKKRSLKKPFQWLVANPDMARSGSDGWNEQAEKLARTFWPGPLTIVVPAQGQTIGWRVPGHAWLLELLTALQRPLVASSANQAGKPASGIFKTALTPFCQKIDLAVDGGTIEPGVASTVVAVKKRGIQILRKGAISKDEIQRVVRIL